MEDQDNKPNINGGPVQRVNTKNALAMAPKTQFAKESSNVERCEKEGCENDMPVAFHMNLGKETKKYCEGCYRKYWEDQGYIRQ